MQLKSLIRYPIDIRRARGLLADKQAEPCQQYVQRPIVLDLRTPQLLFDCGRHLATLAHHARFAGSAFSIRCSPLLLSGMVRKTHGRECLADPHTRWIPSRAPLPEDALVLCDYEPSAGQSSERRLFVGMLLGSDIDRSIPVMPYPMHPSTLGQLERTDLTRLRQKFVRRGIYFAGNQKPSYGSAKLNRNFGVLSRLEIIRTLSENFTSRVTCSMSSVRSERTIILSDSRVEPIFASDWLPTLASAQFFVCCPGSSQPVCHNLIESMSVGTIPLIEYGDRITPQLVDGENAICFRGVSGLIEAIDRIDQLSQEEIVRIRRNVVSFYETHLCGKRFLSRLRDGQFDLSSRRICMPFHERNHYSPPRRLAA